jgi:hypothetical protein
MTRPLVALASVLSVAVALPAAAAPACAPAGAAKAVDATIRNWFGAFARDDYAAGYALQAPGFYAYDSGKRYDGQALGETLKAIKGSGVKIVWNLGAIDVHVACDQAWAAWIDKGTVGKPGAEQPVTWMESAVLAYRDGAWRIVFLHSGRVVTAS